MNLDVPISHTAPRRAILVLPGWLALVALAAWCAAFAALALRPAAGLGEARGLYAQEAGAQPFRWTSSRVLIPLHASGGPIGLALELAAGRWPGRPAQPIALRAGDQLLARFSPGDQPRRYHMLLPPAQGALLLETPVDRPSPADRRWLGVQLYSLAAQSFGLPLRAASQALLVALASIPLGLALRWCIGRGWGAIVGITTLGLLMRLYALDRLPAGFFQDEAVSLLDAWNLAHTGRDHLGNALSLAAFESFGDWVSPLMTYAEVPVVALLGTTPLAGRLVVAVAGALTIPTIYAIARMLRLPGPGASCAALVAALSPWQLIRSRVAGPPSAALLPWALCLLAALWLLRRGGRRQALLFALAAGIGIYAYPTVKLAVPLLVALTLLLALAQELAGDPSLAEGAAGARWWAAIRRLTARWWPAALLLALLWLPFAQLTLLNQYSGMRVDQKLLRADSAADWIAQWLASYAVYFQPAFYYISGDASNGIRDQGVQLPAEAPLALAGLAALIWRCGIFAFGSRISGWRSATRQFEPRRPVDEARRRRASPLRLFASSPHERMTTSKPGDRLAWQLVLGALLIAPLPASLMTPNPHLSRALIVAPVYALLVGLGLATLWAAAERWSPARLRMLPAAAAAIVLAAIAWQGIARFQDYQANYPLLVERKYQDGLREAAERVVAHAPEFDEVWVDDRMSFPYVYVLAAQAMPPAESQATIVVERPRTTFNTVTRVGKYRFTSLKGLPADLPVIEASANSLGEPGYLILAWQQGAKRILVLRSM